MRASGLLFSVTLFPGTQHHVREALAGLFVRLLDNVGVDVRGSAHLCVTQPLGHGYDILPTVDQDGCHSMAKRMRIQIPLVQLLPEGAHGVVGLQDTDGWWSSQLV